MRGVKKENFLSGVTAVCERVVAPPSGVTSNQGCATQEESRDAVQNYKVL
jgi:hypothetical protein